MPLTRKLAKLLTRQPSVPSWNGRKAARVAAVASQVEHFRQKASECEEEARRAQWSSLAQPWLKLAKQWREMADRIDTDR